MRPMLASPSERIPHGPQWAHEVKWDGMRALADIRGGSLSLHSRSGRDITAQFPELAALASTYDDALFDGELVVLREGAPSFSATSERLHASSPQRIARLASSEPVTLMVFDLLRLFGSDLTGQTWSARRDLLERLELSGPTWQVPPVHDDGEELFAATQEQGLEGIVSKRRTSTYAPGRRSSDWLKSAHHRTDSVVVGGWRPEVGSPQRLGAVLVGLPDGHGGLAYAGRVGSGLAGAAGAHLAEVLTPLATAGSPFSTDVPREDITGTTWVRPEVVVEVRALGRGSSGKLRQPAYLGLRTDLEAHAVRSGDAAR